MKRLSRILLALGCLVAGFAMAKLVIPPREVWEKPARFDAPDHPQFATTIFCIGDLLEGDQPLVKKEAIGSEAESQSTFTHYVIRRDEVVRLIERQVAPDTWKDEGGQSVLKAEGDKLFVEQTPANVKAIDGLLESLRNGKRFDITHRQGQSGKRRAEPLRGLLGT